MAFAQDGIDQQVTSRRKQQGALYHLIFANFIPALAGTGRVTVQAFPTVTSNHMSNFSFQTINWEEIVSSQHPGETGMAFWKTLQLSGLRMRIVTYSPGYLADHWCKKGHIVHCLEGEFESELETGERFSLRKDMTYIVSDDLSSHRSYSKDGVRLLIIDGHFLELNQTRICQ